MFTNIDNLNHDVWVRLFPEGDVTLTAVRVGDLKFTLEPTPYVISLDSGSVFLTPITGQAPEVGFASSDEAQYFIDQVADQVAQYRFPAPTLVDLGITPPRFDTLPAWDQYRIEVMGSGEPTFRVVSARLPPVDPVLVHPSLRSSYLLLEGINQGLQPRVSASTLNNLMILVEPFIRRRYPEDVDYGFVVDPLDNNPFEGWVSI